ncbi:HNH endonuclease [Deltaproteobacteria bacterium PRO3]|nr:HNH endonuclease [Deltaproteobacteria bacterium PRO3]
MMILAHDCEPYGVLERNGKTIPNDVIARQCGCDPAEFERLFKELEDAGVPGRTRRGAIYSRRMVRDAENRLAIKKSKSASGQEGAKSKWMNNGNISGLKRSQRLQEARAKGTHTKDEWEALKLSFGGVCPRCKTSGRRIVKDHIVPIYQGGSDSIENIQPLCNYCNSSKGAERINWKDAWQTPGETPGENLEMPGSSSSSSSSSSNKKEKNKKEKRDGEPVPIRQVLARMVAEGLGQ